MDLRNIIKLSKYIKHDILFDDFLYILGCVYSWFIDSKMNITVCEKYRMSSKKGKTWKFKKS